MRQAPRIGQRTRRRQVWSFESAGTRLVELSTENSSSSVPAERLLDRHQKAATSGNVQRCSNLSLARRGGSVVRGQGHSAGPGLRNRDRRRSEREKARKDTFAARTRGDDSIAILIDRAVGRQLTPWRKNSRCDGAPDLVAGPSWSTHSQRPAAFVHNSFLTRHSVSIARSVSNVSGPSGVPIRR